MSLVKQPVTINFSKGLDTKSDPWQVAIGNFLKLQNSIFTKAGLLQKRNGYGQLTSLPDNTSTYLTTFKGGLTAIGDNLQSYSQGSESWVNKGQIQPLDLSTQALVRNNYTQNYADSAVADNGLVCTVYVENQSGTNINKYTVTDQATTQTVVAPTVIQGAGTATNSPRVFYLYPYFIIVFDDLVSATNELKYIAVSASAPSRASAATTISTTYSALSTGTFDGVVVSNELYLFFNGASTTIKAISLSNKLVLSATKTYTSQSCININVTADLSNANNPIIWASWIVPSSKDIKGMAIDTSLNTVLAATTIVSSSAGSNVIGAAENGVLTIYYEVINAYSYDSGIPSHYISTNTLTQAGTAGSPSILIRSVGLASKSFFYSGVVYFFAIYQSPYQPTYFLLNASGQVIARFAYQNGPGYYVTGLSSVTINGSVVNFPYLYKDLIEAVNKNTNVTSGTQTAGIYSQTGVNFLNIDFGTAALSTTEIGNNLNISGGFVSMYDGVQPVEQNFFLYPDSIEVSTSGSGGSISAQQYFYQVTYEWTDNQGNAFRSAPSIPVSVTTTGSTSTNTINVPTLRLTYKINSPVKIVIYRWSVAQPIYYQITSITQPSINSTLTDSIGYGDTLSDATILGNNILYTTGGVVEDVGPPPTSSMFLFDDRPWLIDAEDRNLLWYGKQVIEATPCEFSDLFTVYVAPTTSSEGSSGDLNFGFPMDDKAILFKDSALYYFNGTGPDNTGANGQYSQPILITSTVGSSNQNSCVLIPSGLMFQSNKGIWLLGRDLSTTYIGAAVEEFNSNLVLSAVNVPSENQVRFTLDNGVTLMYDYFYNQWGTFVNVPAISSTVYQGLHTFINNRGEVYQETPGKYLDGSNPVLLGFITSWLNLAGLQGYQRAYFFFLLGKYLTPHKLQISIAYDYNDSPEQVDLISPDNFSPAYGAASANGQQTVYGQNTPYGGPSNVERWRIFFTKQKCQAFQITLQEIYDPSFGVPAGQGLTLSGINMIAAVKKGYRPISSSNSVGG